MLRMERGGVRLVPSPHPLFPNTLPPPTLRFNQYFHIFCSHTVHRESNHSFIHHFILSIHHSSFLFIIHPSYSSLIFPIHLSSFLFIIHPTNHSSFLFIIHPSYSSFILPIHHPFFLFIIHPFLVIIHPSY